MYVSCTIGSRGLQEKGKAKATKYIMARGAKGGICLRRERKQIVEKIFKIKNSKLCYLEQ